MASDTVPSARAAQLEALRSLGAEGRLRLGLELSEDARRIAVDGVRRRHPELSLDEARRSVIAALYGDRLAAHAFRNDRDR